MLLLTSITDKLQVITGSAGNIDVHASWMDNVSGAVAPGRTNTNISTAATTDVVAPPAASTQRNIKTLHVRNRGASSNVITVQHTDGVNVAQLWSTVLQAGETLQYIDEIGFIPVAGARGVPLLRVITATGTYTPTPGMVYCEIEVLGAGGGGGAAQGSTGQFYGGGGGGSGGYSRAIKTAAQIGASQVVTIGAGGTGGTVPSNTGGTGGDTSVGALCVAKGGLGGAGQDVSGGAAVQVGKGGAGAPTTGAIGDMVAAGTPGAGGIYGNGAAVINLGGEGASSVYGGGATAVFGATGVTAPGTTGNNYGGGGSGAFANNSSGSAAGGAGSPGAVFITEHF